ncbi:C40 family peptidase [Dactylosporangium matsuzakiense]|nr:C40 family peptidase [Dactylosporangium matsuzakiense]UWZ41616.1 LysM peptidoglycan-binding domain-containing C40 family peptidase [Dactylosporangium matsuzakiense]
MRHRRMTAVLAALASLPIVLVPQAAHATESPQTVVVQPGDTLWNLSRRNGTTVEDLQRLNNLGTSTLIRIGQTLILHDDAAAIRARKTATAIAYAKAQVGKPYRFATAGPDTFDCSGLVMKAWEAAGYQLPRVTYDQIKVGERVTRDQLIPGDLVFTNNGGHVELYIGDDTVVNAGHTGVSVHLQDLPREEQIVAYVHLTDV